MPATTSCTPCCVETQSVQVPGIEGEPGSDGTNGIDAFTTTTADFVVPAVDTDVTIFVEESGWMVVGQPIFVGSDTDGPATFRVASITNATQISATFLGQTGDVSPGATVSSGSGVSPGGIQGTVTNQSVYGAGTAATLPTTSALLNFGTTDPSLTLTGAGTWLLFASAVVEFAAWKSTSKTVTLKIRRTNNTAADVTNATVTVTLPDTAAAAVTYTAYTLDLPAVEYTNSGAGDILELWGAVSAAASVSGDMTVSAASLVAVKIA